MRKKRGVTKSTKREVMTTCAECGRVFLAKRHGSMCPACMARDKRLPILKAQ